MEEKTFSADVSVLIPNYNHAHLLPECLEAIFSQTVLPKEVIVIDDASTDLSIEVVRNYQKTYPQLILIQLSKNQGPAAALNVALQQAQGRYLAFCSADDQVLPGFFEEGEKSFVQYPEAGIVCSDPSFFADVRPYVFQRRSIFHSPKPVSIPPEKICQILRNTPLWIPSHASLFRKDLVLQYGGFIPALRHLCDWYINLKIALLHGIVYVPSSFGAFRLSEQSYGALWNRWFGKGFRVYDKLFEILASETEIFSSRFRKSGVLGLLKSHALIYLLLHPRLWKYLPSAFYRKFCNLLRKKAFLL